MSELNIQRRLRWWRERDPQGIIKVSQESVDADPALQRAFLELPYARLRKPRQQQLAERKKRLEQAHKNRLFEPSVNGSEDPDIDKKGA